MTASDGLDNDGNYSDLEIQAFYGTTGGETSKDQPSARLGQSDGSHNPYLMETAAKIFSMQTNQARPL